MNSCIPFDRTAIPNDHTSLFIDLYINLYTSEALPTYFKMFNADFLISFLYLLQSVLVDIASQKHFPSQQMKSTLIS